MNRTAAIFLSVGLIIVVAVSSFIVLNLALQPAPTPGSTDIVWQAKIETNAENYIAANGKVFLADGLGNIHCFDAGNGESLWKLYAGGGDHYHQLVESDGKFYYSDGQAVIAVNETSGHVEVQYIVAPPPTLNGYQDVVSFTIEDNRLLCSYKNGGRTVFDLPSGQALWATAPEHEMAVYATNASIATSTLPHIESDSQTLKAVALNLNNGSTVWQYPAPPTTIMVTENRAVLVNYAPIESYLAAKDAGEQTKEHIIVCLDRATGRQLWSTPTTYMVFNVKLDGNTVFFASFDGCYYALNIADGQIKWKTQVADLKPTNQNTTLASLSTCLTAQPLIDRENNRLVWLASERYRSDPAMFIMALDMENGAQSWSAPVNEAPIYVIGWESNMAVANNHLFVSRDSKLMCVDSSSGSVLWTRSFLDVQAYPVLAGDRVIVASGRNITAYK